MSAGRLFAHPPPILPKLPDSQDRAQVAVRSVATLPWTKTMMRAIPAQANDVGAIMLMRNFGCLAAAIAFCIAASPAAAQQSRTTSGLFGQTTTGPAAATGRTSTSPTTTGTTGGQTSTGNSTAPTNAANAAVGQENLATTAVQLSQTVGEFAGADAADTQNFLSRQTGPVRVTTNNLGSLQNLFSQSLQQLNQQTQRAARPQIRVPLRLGFQAAPVSQTHVRKFETNLSKLPGIRFIGPAEVTLEGRTAVLRGVVASEEDRRTAEALAKMEPEILAVKNELTVEASATTTPEPLPAATNSP